MHPSTLAKRVYLLIFALIIVFYFYGLGKLPLLGPDEPRYAQVAREMFLNRDLITPTLGGHTWFEKPALLYWMIVAAFKVFGVSEWSARLGPAICGLLTIVAVWCVGREVDRSDDSRGFGFWSLLTITTCLGLIVFSRAVSFDVVITMTTTWSLAFFLLHELPSTKNKSLLLAGFYVFVGLSLLAKGLVGIVIPFGVVGLYYLFRRAWPQSAVWLSLIWGLPLALLVSATWYGPVIARHGWTFIDEFFVQHHFARFVSNKYHHPQPFYFYPAIILMLALPWTVHLIIALVKARKWQWRGGDSLSIVRVFSLAWLLLPIVFFSFSGSKLPGYILPVVPAAALLVADRLTVVQKARWPLVIAGATIALVVIVLNFFAMPFARRESVKDLLVLADARGYATAPVIAQRGDDRSAEFYAYGRVIYRADGEVMTFDEISVDAARALGGKFVVFIPVQYVENYRGAPRIEIIGDNGHTAVLGWQP
ncbi:MAG TPA: glycosyltransferase family 39 protein [Pyrinomonadaceae bacterium]|nr:glycosyltransferase family 39 protein [Pyrinomonadaceae bacterium]